MTEEGPVAEGERGEREGEREGAEGEVIEERSQEGPERRENDTNGGTKEQAQVTIPLSSLQQKDKVMF